ncbi:outer membrane lipoprotein-sorting protein [Marinivivus vitaminiproducens]|uniref:outer membrane lipoprotein-sorting protein n=1 Tax=Marinivivus vitaminiproducens TaxID=3035935 RepID=UPI00279F24AE|nr:outer membrane lipoprotein-sorting protein [Geminicoccaceae bacterium SCSIO 64248]
MTDGPFLLPRRSFLGASAAFASAFALGSPALAVGNVDPVAVLERADEIRNPQESFVVDVGLTAYDSGRVIDETVVTTHSRKDGDGQFLSLVLIDQPVRDRGKIILRNGNLLWFYDPASKASVRLSPRQRLLGNASNGDVVTANLALDYDTVMGGLETVTDGEKQERSAYRLELTSRNEATPYDRIDLWVDQETYRPLKGQYYTQSGRLLKVAWYRGWESVMGETRPTEVVIADGFKPKEVTVMKLANFRARDLPQSWFSNSWLPRFQKQ